MPETTIKIFWSGRSQAVRLPKVFRFDTEQVRIRRHGAALILEPVPQDWAWLDKLGAPDHDFLGAAAEQALAQERNEVGDLSE